MNQLYPLLFENFKPAHLGIIKSALTLSPTGQQTENYKSKSMIVLDCESHMVEDDDVKFHAKNLVLALQTLTPSRNKFVQLFALLPQDYLTAYDTFPEFIKEEDKRSAMNKAFGISFVESFEGKVELNYSLGNAIYSFYTNISNLFDQEGVIEGLAILSGIPKDEIPNPSREWLRILLEGLREEPNLGLEAFQILKTVKDFAEEKDEINPDYKISLSKIEERTNIEERRILSIIALLFKYKLIEKSIVYEENKEDHNVQKEGIGFVRELSRNTDLIDLMNS